MAEAPGKKYGRWQGKNADDFKDYQKAVREILHQQPEGSTWVVEMEVKRIGNPIHDYRIVLTPGGG